MLEGNMGEDAHAANFHEMELDDRILKAIAKQNWGTPTLIQQKAIPLVLEGKDALMRARTGTGKTAAFVIPLVQKILTSKQMSARQETKALILAPSKELCGQISKVVRDLTVKCSREVRCVDIAPNVDLNIQKPMLVEKPDIIVSTPARVLKHVKEQHLNVKQSLEILVIDEADLMFSFGYEDEIKELLNYFPAIHQTVLASATLSEDVRSLRSLVLHNPVVLKLEEPDLPPSSQLTHYHLHAEEISKATILYALLKLNLIRGKTIIFVNTVDNSYKIKLFLEQFAIATCVLNSELPATIRCHSVNQFNQGVYDVIIASDEGSLEQPGERTGKIRAMRSRRRKDKESGVSRGIDFQCVSNVINFDFPLTVQAYVHRAGRTARGNNQGSVLSFVSIKEQKLLKSVEDHLKSVQCDENVFKTYEFKLDEVEAFRYRAQDAWRAVTRIAVREARLKEIKQEVFNCQKLKSYFEDNPTDLQVLRHDKALHTVKIQPHLADVPEYIVPPTLKSIVNTKRNAKRRRHRFGRTSDSNKLEVKKSNPLVSMQFEGFQNKKRKF